MWEKENNEHLLTRQDHTHEAAQRGQNRKTRPTNAHGRKTIAEQCNRLVGLQSHSTCTALLLTILHVTYTLSVGWVCTGLFMQKVSGNTLRISEGGTQAWPPLSHHDDRSPERTAQLTHSAPGSVLSPSLSFSLNVCLLCTNSLTVRFCPRPFRIAVVRFLCFRSTASFLSHQPA